MKKMKLLFIAFVAILVAVYGCSQQKKPLMQDYLEVSFSGSNGSGTAQIQMHLENFEADISKQLNLDLESINDTGKLIAIEMAINYEVVPAINLSNGDKVTLICTVDETIMNDMELDLTGFEKEIEVSGLS